jgi:hypothetical protein
MTQDVEHMPIEDCAAALDVDLCIVFRDTAAFFGEEFCRRSKLADPKILGNIPAGVNSILLMGSGPRVDKLLDDSWTIEIVHGRPLFPDVKGRGRGLRPAHVMSCEAVWVIARRARCHRCGGGDATEIWHMLPSGGTVSMCKPCHAEAKVEMQQMLDDGWEF